MRRMNYYLALGWPVSVLEALTMSTPWSVRPQVQQLRRNLTSKHRLLEAAQSPIERFCPNRQAFSPGSQARKSPDPELLNLKSQTHTPCDAPNRWTKYRMTRHGAIDCHGAQKAHEQLRRCVPRRSKLVQDPRHVYSKLGARVETM